MNRKLENTVGHATLTNDRKVFTMHRKIRNFTLIELLVVIANHGYSDLIMDAARGAGAAGGTVIHAKGTGMEGAEKFLGISLAAEKEMIYIVVHRDKRNDIMSAIMRDAGMASKAKSICFTLPVSATAGLRLIEED